MDQEEFEALLRDSSFFRHMMVELLKSSEQTMAIVTAAVARQIDAAILETDLLVLQQRAAVESPDPTRDHILNTIRRRLSGKTAH